MVGHNVELQPCGHAIVIGKENKNKISTTYLLHFIFCTALLLALLLLFSAFVDHPATFVTIRCRSLLSLRWHLWLPIVLTEKKWRQKKRDSEKCG